MNIDEIVDKIIEEEKYVDFDEDDVRENVLEYLMDFEEKETGEDTVDIIVDKIRRKIKPDQDITLENNIVAINAFLEKLFKYYGKPITVEKIERGVNYEDVESIENNEQKIALGNFIKSPTMRKYPELKRVISNFLNRTSEQIDVERLATENLNLRSVLNPSKIREVNNRGNLYSFWKKIREEEEKFIEEIEKLMETQIFKKDLENNEYAKEIQKIMQNKKDELYYVHKFQKRKIKIAGKESRALSMFFKVLQKIDGTFISLKDLLQEEGKQRESESADDKTLTGQEKEAFLDFEELYDLNDYYQLTKIVQDTNIDPIGYMYIIDDLEEAGVLLGEKEEIKEYLNVKLDDVLEYFEEEGVPYSAEDIDTLEDFIENGIVEMTEISEDDLYLPIFALESTSLGRTESAEQSFRGGKYERMTERIDSFLQDKSLDINKIEENILNLLENLRNYLEDENTIFQAQSYMTLLGVAEPSKQEKDKIKEGRKYAGIEYYLDSRSKRGEYREDVKKINSNIKKITELVEKIYFLPFASPHIFGMDLPFEGNGDVRILMSYKENQSYASRIASLLRKRGEALVTPAQLDTIKKFMNYYLGAESRNDLNSFVDKAEEFYDEMLEIYEHDSIKDVETKNVLKKDLARDIASLIGNIADEIAYSGKEIKFQGINVKEAFEERKQFRVGDNLKLQEIGALYSFFELIDTLPQSFTTNLTEEQRNKIKELQILSEEIRKQDFSTKLLEAHDSLRILKRQPIYYEYYNPFNLDDMENFLSIAQTTFKKNYTALEVGNIVEEIDSFDNISKSYGVSTEDVYIIKSHFR